MPVDPIQIVAAWEEGLRVPDIAEAFGVSNETVHGHLTRAGIASREAERESREEEKRRMRQRIMSMARKGFRTITIARMTGVSHAQVRSLITSAYIITRDHTGSEVLLPRHEKNRIERPGRDIRFRR
ncbi:MAG: helix-turn-helix domain-containing protein [Rhodothermales bacterium]